MMRKVARTLSMLALFILPATLLPSTRVFADSIGLNLTAPVQTGMAGSTVAFSATVSAPATNGGTVFLNGDSFDVTTPLVFDDSGFLFNFPLSLDPGGSFSGELFSFALPSDLPAGQYVGSFEILGGADGGVLDTLSTVDFQVNVTGAPTVPEPETLFLLAAGLPGVAMLIKGRRRRSSDKNP
jgi:hypothetical protein